jgi:hypothetical protein
MEIYSGGVSHLAPCDGLKKRWRTLLPQYAKVLKFTNMDLRNILLQLVTTEPVPRVVQPILSMEEDKKNLLCLVWCGIVCDACNKVNTGEHMMPTMKPSTRRTITTMSQGTRSLYLLRESWDRRKNNLTHHKDHDCPIVLAGVRYHCTSSRNVRWRWSLFCGHYNNCEAWYTVEMYSICLSFALLSTNLDQIARRCVIYRSSGVFSPTFYLSSNFCY